MTNYLPPFLTRMQEYSIYAKVQLLGHREYNTIEVMGLEDDKGKMLIHVIISLHDGSGLRFINDREVVTNIKLETPARKAFYRPIELEHSIDDESRRIDVRFYTEKNEEIILSLSGGKASYYPQSLMSQPTGFIKHHELPVGFSFKLRKVLTSSNIRVNRRSYKLAPVNDFLGFRYGSLGRMAENYVRLNLHIPPERMHCTHFATEYKVGDGWSYTVGSRTLSYEIASIDSEGMILTRKNEEHRVLLLNNVMHLARISTPTENDQSLDINFVPPIPLTPHSDKATCRVAVVSENVAVYEGNLTIVPSKEGNIITLIGDRKYHTAEDDLAYETIHQDDWVLNNIHQNIL